MQSEDGIPEQALKYEPLEQRYHVCLKKNYAKPSGFRKR
jgi:hypothetical protein